MDDHSQAISFTNGYFALVDGLASGFEDHLTEDVILDWFGKMVKGRRQVAAFIQRHKVSSRHMFANISSVSNIGYKASPTHGRTVSRRSDSDGKGDDKVVIDISSRFDQILQPKGVEGTKNRDHDGKKQETMTTDDMTYYLNEGDLNNLFKLEIASTNIEEIERSINRIKLEEEMAPAVEAVKRECGQSDGPDVVRNTGAIKYVEARGQIEFSRKISRRVLADRWNGYNSAAIAFHTWRRDCKLQIAYSATTQEKTLQVSPAKSQELAQRPRRCSIPRQCRGQLLSLEEINEISNRLVPNVDSFGGYLRKMDFFEDREDFLQSIESQMADKETNLSLFAPHYFHNKLVFNRPDGIYEQKHVSRNQKCFVFNYQIHLIIYEGRNKCRTNLMDQFEKQM